MATPDFTARLTVESLAAPGSAPTTPRTGSAPFVIGVTGHRNLAAHDLATARGAVTSFFDAICSQLPDTELTVMLGMAAGGDLAVAEIALERGLHLQAVLPMPLADYVADFDSWNLQLLRRLLDHPNTHCSELPVTAHAAHGDDPPSPAWREAAYRNLTDVLVGKSNLLLALWDGKPSARPGGTADTVLRCLRVRTDENMHASRLDFASGDPDADTDSPFVYWIPIAAGGSDPGTATAAPRFLTGFGDTIMSFSAQTPLPLRRRLEELNEYNRDFRALMARGGSTATDSLLAKVPADLALEERPKLARIDAEYGRADALALYYQKRSDSLFGLFGTVAFALGCLYLIYDKLGERQGFLLAYLVILLASVTLYRLLYTKLWFVKHLRYRALAETMRVKFYLCLSGVDYRVDAAEVMALSGIERFDGFGWIAYVLKSVEPISIAAISAPDARRTDYVREAWVEDQYRYFVRKVAQLERKSRRVAQGQLATLLIMIAVLLLRMTLGPWLLAVHVAPTVPLKNLLVFGVGVAALLLGAWKLHQSKMATRELIWQYRNQLGHFSRIHSELDRTVSPQRRNDLLVELGRRSLMESYLWTIHRYHREHAPPAGG